MDTPSTKKLPVALAKDGRPTPSSEFLVPSLDGGPGFVGIRSGKRRAQGCVAYTGVTVSSSDLLEKIDLRDVPHEQAQRIIDRFINELQQLRVGNIIEVEVAPDSAQHLRKVAERPQARESRLP